MRPSHSFLQFLSMCLLAPCHFLAPPKKEVDGRRSLQQSFQFAVASHSMRFTSGGRGALSLTQTAGGSSNSPTPDSRAPQALRCQCPVSGSGHGSPWSLAPMPLTRPLQNLLAQGTHRGGHLASCSQGPRNWRPGGAAVVGRKVEDACRPSAPRALPLAVPGWVQGPERWRWA